MAARTERIYQRDSFLTRFGAAVLDLRSEPAARPEGSARLAVLLDRTAFYPTGGGQPHDTGTIAGLPVVDVRESESGPLHIVEMRDPGGRAHGAHVTVGAEVEGVVAWERRFDHMQQHSGQHVLSRAFIDLAGSRTCSFHLGEKICTIDVEMARPDPAAIRAAEDRANEIVFSDRAVVVREVAVEDTAAGAPLDPAMSGLNLKPGEPIRIIEFDGFDSTPCGGTHVARSGQIGLLAVSGWETYKGMSRISFVCGGRAATQMRDLNDVISACVARLSARADELPALLDKLLSERDDLGKRLRDLKGNLARHEAEAAVPTAPSIGGLRLLRRVYGASECDVDAAQALVRSFVASPGRIALVAVIDSGQGTVLAARSAGTKPDAAGNEPLRIGDLIAEVARSVGGRGGGSVTFGRAGGIPAARVEEILDAAVARLSAVAPSSRP